MLQTHRAPFHRDFRPLPSLTSINHFSNSSQFLLSYDDLLYQLTFNLALLIKYRVLLFI